VKSKVDVGGRERFRISRFNKLRNERISSFFADGIACHKLLVPDIIVCHSSLARKVQVDERRWLNSAAIAERSEEGGCDGIRRTSRDLTSPMPGPPNTRISSEDEPPLSLMGIM
jgi:hypothetical protein